MSIFNIKGGHPHIIGIDIGSATLKVVGLKVGQVSSLSFSSIVDLRKDNSDKYIVDAIQKTLRDNNISAKDSVLIFADDSFTVRRLTLPKMSHDEIPNALRWQIRDIVHFDIDKAVVDFQVLGEVQKEDGSKFLEVMVVIVSKEAMGNRLEILKSAGLNPVSVTAAPFALENIVKQSEAANIAKTAVIVDFGHTKTGVSIIRDGKLEFVRPIPIGSKDITDAMVGSLVTDKGKFEISKERAEEIKMRVGIPYEDTILEGGLAAIQVLSLDRPVIERLSKEIRRSIDYYVQEYAGEDNASIYLTGGGANLKNLDRYLSEELNIPVKRLALPRSVNIPNAYLKNEEILTITSIVGAVLGYRNRPNLLPHEYKVEKIEFIEKVSLRMIAIIMAVALLASFSFIKFRVDDYKYRLRNVVFQRNILKQIKDLHDRVVQRTEFLTQARGSEIPVEYIMKELSSIIPPNIVLDSLNINEKNKTIDIQGTVYGPRGSAEDALTKFMEGMESSRCFRDAQLSSIQDKKIDREEAAGFDITCSLE